MVGAVIGSIILAVIGYLLQIAAFPAFGAIAIAPNIIISLTIAFAMIYGPWAALSMGFLGGLMVDFMAGGAIGISCLVPVIFGFLISMLKKEINSRHFIMAMIFSSFAHIINDLWVVLTMYFARYEIFINWGTLLRSLVSAIETGIFAAIIFIIVTRLIAMGEKRSSVPFLQRY
jgi:rod shape-determining protein MreD